MVVATTTRWRRALRIIYCSIAQKQHNRRKRRRGTSAQRRWLVQHQYSISTYRERIEHSQCAEQARARDRNDTVNIRSKFPLYGRSIGVIESVEEKSSQQRNGVVITCCVWGWFSNQVRNRIESINAPWESGQCRCSAVRW